MSRVTAIIPFEATDHRLPVMAVNHYRDNVSHFHKAQRDKNARELKLQRGNY